ncbi:hypothetical protein EJ08DRAFT_650905 [Tothia fuscella]|uniref:Acyl-coenzyme A diphosphatase SCS3 n=1 Tax=Tothia fuscella TaxID=1048955 RepID=A0A9P4TXC9_9PEZI|nr:hypothetical protein EJ08DRAFT_650905 [Tothia fuscella]
MSNSTPNRRITRSTPSTIKDLADGLPDTPIKQMRHPSETSPFLPTKLETLLLAIYPVTLVLGSLFSLLAYSTRSATSKYNPIHQSYYPAAGAPSYFATKKNIFNVYFVKKGWFWTTLALAAFVVTHPSLGPSLRPTVTRRRVQAVARWGVATTVWMLVTQWCFGPALVDRNFKLTGGACEIMEDPIKRAEMGRKQEFFTAQACKASGGLWKGGHDISGHVFLLILGSALLGMEILPAILRARGLNEERRVRVGSGKVVKTRSIVDGTVKDTPVPVVLTETEEEYTKLGIKVAVGVVGLSWWMLFMTAAFFHTWFEKFTGFLVAFTAIFLVYFLPRGVPEVRAVLGMPGL